MGTDLAATFEKKKKGSMPNSERMANPSVEVHVVDQVDV